MGKEAKKSMYDRKIIRSTFEAIGKIGKILVKANTPFAFAQFEFLFTILFFFDEGGYYRLLSELHGRHILKVSLLVAGI